jgi:hypothetical protein
MPYSGKTVTVERQLQWKDSYSGKTVTVCFRLERRLWRRGSRAMNDCIADESHDDGDDGIIRFAVKDFLLESRAT